MTLFTNESGQDHVVQYLDKKNIHDFAFYFLLSMLPFISFPHMEEIIQNLAKVAFLEDIKKYDKLQKYHSL